jgi:hypothetical protein
MAGSPTQRTSQRRSSLRARPGVGPNMPLQPTVTCPALREYAQQGPRQRLNAGRSAARMSCLGAVSALARGAENAHTLMTPPFGLAISSVTVPTTHFVRHISGSRKADSTSVHLLPAIGASAHTLGRSHGFLKAATRGPFTLPFSERVHPPQTRSEHLRAEQHNESAPLRGGVHPPPVAYLAAWRRTSRELTSLPSPIKHRAPTSPRVGRERAPVRRPNMPLQPTVTCPVVREYAPQGPRQRLNAGR